MENEQAVNNLVVEDVPLLPESNLVSAAEVNPTQARFSSADWLDIAKETRVTLVGAGGIGSWVALFLSRIRTRLTIWDSDRFEMVNLAGQLASIDCIDKYKVVAINQICQNFGGTIERCFPLNFSEESDTHKVMITGLDNMAARKLTFNSWKKKLSNTDDKRGMLYIDGRLAADSYQLYAFCGDDEAAIQKYESTALFSDEDADDTVCSFKQTSHLAAILAGKMVTIFTNHCLYKLGLSVWTIPYCEEFEAPLFCTMNIRV